MDGNMTSQQHESKVKILDATIDVIRSKGYAATSVDDICKASALTKGSFFHHFKSKDELAIAAVDRFATKAAGYFEMAPYQKLTDPGDRVLGYVDFRIAMLKGKVSEFTCLFGTLVQETYETHPAIREACERHLSVHAAKLAADIAEAKEQYSPKASWSPESLTQFIEAALQGAFIMAKTKQRAAPAEDCLQHLRRYLETQLGRDKQTNRQRKGK